MVRNPPAQHRFFARTLGGARVEPSAARLTPVAFGRGLVARRMTDHAHRRWRGVCVAAAKQSGAEFLPEIAEPVSLAGVKAICQG